VRGVDVDAVVEFMNDLVKGRPDLIVVVTDGFANVCLSVLSKGFPQSRDIVTIGKDVDGSKVFHFPQACRVTRDNVGRYYV
jgi:hypothetical protein